MNISWVPYAFRTSRLGSKLPTTAGVVPAVLDKLQMHEPHARFIAARLEPADLKQVRLKAPQVAIQALLFESEGHGKAAG